MIYHFIHYFSPATHYQYRHISDEEKLEIAKAKAAKDLAEKLLENAVFKVNRVGDVEGYIEIP